MNTILQQAILATPKIAATQTENLLRVLTEQALNGTVQWQRNFVLSINDAITRIDMILAKQVTEIIHHHEFQKLEGSWRGIKFLIKNSPSNANLKIKLMHVTKNELLEDFDQAMEFDQSQLFKKIYEAEFGMSGGEPYGALLGDYSFNHHARDMLLLKSISGVAASAFCPFISAADASMMGFSDWQALSKPRDCAKIFSGLEYATWQNFRESEDSRFVCLTLPRVLARLPYADESVNSHEEYCWMNAAYAFGTRLTAAFNEHGWCTAIRGSLGGGKVANLPCHTFVSDDGDIDNKCPTEVGITDRREAELSRLGFLPLCHYKNTDYAVFFGAETTQLAQKFESSEATANAAISARLPYIMATSRFTHYLKVMARDKIGSFLETEEIEQWLNHWILKYVNGNANSKQALKAKYPLAEAKVSVQAVADNPGSYRAIAWLRPWLQMEELTASMRLVAQIPKMQ